MSYTTTFKQVKDKYGESMLIEVRTPTGKITLKDRLTIREDILMIRTKGKLKVSSWEREDIRMIC